MEKVVAWLFPEWPVPRMGYSPNTLKRCFHRTSFYEPFHRTNL